MTVIINPGAHIGEVPNSGWTNTYEAALTEAERCLQSMADEGFGHDLELIPPADTTPRDGRWLFTYRHRVTGATATLETHGIEPFDEYLRQRIFAPKVYWNGSSCSSPTRSDWAAPGFVQTFRPEGDAVSGGAR